MIVRSASANKDIRTRLLKAIGRLADMNISSESRRIAVDELTAALQGKSLSKETFDQFDIETEIVKEANKPELLIVTVPSEFLPNSLVGQDEPVKVEFTISKVLDTDFRGR